MRFYFDKPLERFPRQIHRTRTIVAGSDQSELADNLVEYSAET